MTREELLRLIENAMRMVYGQCPHYNYKQAEDKPRMATDCYTCIGEKVIDAMERRDVVTWNLN